jgi:hypothetical protein
LPAEVSKFSQFVIFYALGAIFSGEALNWPSRCRFPIILAVIFGSFWILFATTSLSENDPILGGVCAAVFYPPQSRGAGLSLRSLASSL